MRYNLKSYTVDEARELAGIFDSVEGSLENYNIRLMETCIIDNKADIQKFLGVVKNIAVLSKDSQEIYNLVFIAELEDMPLHINDTPLWKALIARWRLRINK